MPIISMSRNKSFLNNSEWIYGRSREPSLNPTTLNNTPNRLSITVLELRKLLFIKPILRPSPPTKNMYPTAPTNSFLDMSSEAK